MNVFEQLTLDALRATGIHIGTNHVTRDMFRFVEKQESGIYTFRITEVLSRLQIVAKALSRYNNVVVYCRELPGSKPIQMFSTLAKFRGITGRFFPGTLTNPLLSKYISADAVLVVKPNYLSEKNIRLDEQIVTEATDIRIPVFAIVDSDNVTSNVDVIIPANTRGHRALAALFWLLTQSLLVAKGELNPSESLPFTIDDYQSPEPKLKKKIDIDDEIRDS